MILAGDVFFIKRHGRLEHCGIIYGSNGGVLVTIEKSVFGTVKKYFAKYLADSSASVFVYRMKHTNPEKEVLKLENKTKFSIKGLFELNRSGKFLKKFLELMEADCVEYLYSCSPTDLFNVVGSSYEFRLVLKKNTT